MLKIENAILYKVNDHVESCTNAACIHYWEYRVNFLLISGFVFYCIQKIIQVENLHILNVNDFIMSLFYEVMALVGYRISKMSQGHFWYEKKTSHHFLLRFSGDRILLTSIFYLAIGWKLSIVFFGKIFETNTGSLYKF